MKYTFEFHPGIASDYDEAYQWYEEKSQGLGEQFFESVREELEKISDNHSYLGSGQKKGLEKQE